jgi:preprotein translocase subunit SecA
MNIQSLTSPFAAAKGLFAPKVTRPTKADYELIARIGQQADQLSDLSDAELVDVTTGLRERVLDGEPVTSDAIIEPAFAAVVSALQRVMSINLYDVQLLGGLTLARDMIAEMQTGEGKTFTSLLPSYLHALPGAGVHVMTVNAYLCERDYEELAPIYTMLGLSVGLISAESSPEDKREAYACDITYGPGYEYGFDFLRDQVALIARRKPRLGESFRAKQRGLTFDASKPMQRGHAVAIVDEADSVMLDEAMSPLVMATGSKDPAPNTHVYMSALEVASRLERERHFVVDEAASTLQLTSQAMELLSSKEDKTPQGGLDRSWSIYVEQALRAQWLYRCDVDYVVVDGEIQLVDQYTGRIFKDRSWGEGLHQAVQAKEGVNVTTENNIMARVTRQRYLMRYNHLCGMTGTAEGGDRELRSVYKLDVKVIPPNRPTRRIMLPLQTFGDLESKERAVVNALIQTHGTGQPVLIGTASIETSVRIAELIDLHGISYQLLNGKQDAEESEIIAQAGQLGSVTISTNMAGRGTDIKLGPGVEELGGLHVIATEPQESTRVDRQLYGRAARQGDPGSCQLFASADDDLFARYAPSLTARMQRAADANGHCAGDYSHDVAAVQTRVEILKANQRSDMFTHDDWLENVLRELG